MIFSTSFQFSGPTEIGVDAILFGFPHDAEAGKEKMTVTFVQFSPEAQLNMQMTDAELLSYVKSTFLGTSRPAVSSKERTIFGKKSVGEILSSKIPSPSNLEIHLITLNDSSKICIGFKSSAEITAEQSEAMIFEVINNLKNK
jgi:hypothetical protein